jgi:hypothetical protein
MWVGDMISGWYRWVQTMGWAGQTEALMLLGSPPPRHRPAAVVIGSRYCHVYHVAIRLNGNRKTSAIVEISDGVIVTSSKIASN